MTWYLFLHLSTTHWRSRPSLRICLLWTCPLKPLPRWTPPWCASTYPPQNVPSSPLYEPGLFLWTCPQVWQAGTHGVQVGTSNASDHLLLVVRWCGLGWEPARSVDYYYFALIYLSFTLHTEFGGTFQTKLFTAQNGVAGQAFTWPSPTQHDQSELGEDG